MKEGRDITGGISPIDRWIEQERAEYLANQVFHDANGKQISREEAIRQAFEELIPDHRLEAYEHELASVLIDRTVLAAALKQIERTGVVSRTNEWGNRDDVCTACGVILFSATALSAEERAHDANCGLVRVHDALRKALNK